MPCDVLPHLRDLPIRDLEGILAGAGHRTPHVLARELAQALHSRCEVDPDRLGLGQHTRAWLEERYRLAPLLTPLRLVDAQDGTARQHLLGTGDARRFEVVRLKNLKARTLCLSSQVGCALACTFCATGTLGLERNLSPGEITESLVRAQRDDDARISDVVFMGQGEPLHNYEAVMTACENLQHPWGHAISRRRITISTSGLVPAVRRYTAERRPWRLHLSLHAAVEATRRALMPIARTYPLDDLLDAFREHQQVLGVKWLTFQYVALPGINMDEEHVDALARRLVGLRVILNVIPWNDTGGTPYRAPTWAEVKAFTTSLRRVGCPIKVRYSGGKQEGMGCGQLAGGTLPRAPTGGHISAPPGLFSDLVREPWKSSDVAAPGA
jgi:23S rRNA (adenine2503-C2)-methyltransferase